MTIVNRRNALLGWSVWKIGKRVAKKKARAAVPGTVEGSSWRPNISAIVSAGAAAVGGALWFWRRKRTEPEPEPEPEPAE